MLENERERESSMLVNLLENLGNNELYVWKKITFYINLMMHISDF